jgi:hypothetical protein
MSDTEIFANKVMEHVTSVGDQTLKEVGHVRKSVACLRDDVTRIETKQDAHHEMYNDLKRRVESLEKSERAAAFQRGKAAAMGGVSGGVVAAVIAYFKSHSGG